MALRLTHFLLAVFVAAGCTGTIADQAPTDDDALFIPIDETETEPPCPAGEVCVGSSQLIRLTATHYRRTVQRVLGASIVVDDELIPEDHRVEGFSSNEGVSAGLRDVEVYARLAGNVSAQAMAASESLVQCDSAADAVGCALETAQRIGLGLYRRPLSADESAGFEAHIRWVLEEDTFEAALGDVIEVMLQSPNFLYQVEAASEEPMRLSAHEVATRLAHYMYREGPDDELLAAATAGELDTAADVVAWATQMSEDPRAEATMREFHREWLGVDQIGHIDRTEQGLDPLKAQDMRREAELFGAAITQGGGTLPELLTARWSVLNAGLAAHYGVEAPADVPAGEGFGRVEMNERSGILTLGGVVTVHGSPTFTSPVFRGLFVRNRLLCQELPEAPAGALESAEEREAELPEGSSEREQLNAVTMTPGCENCHTLMNPIGHALAAFDDVGRFRMTDTTGQLVDIAGELRSGSAHQTDVDGTFVGAHDLGERLAASEDVSRCYTRQWFRYSLQRLDRGADTTSVDAAHEAFIAADLRIKALMVALTGTDAFLYRQAPR